MHTWLIDLKVYKNLLFIESPLFCDVLLCLVRYSWQKSVLLTFVQSAQWTMLQCTYLKDFFYVFSSYFHCINVFWTSLIIIFDKFWKKILRIHQCFPDPRLVLVSLCQVRIRAQQRDKVQVGYGSQTSCQHHFTDTRRLMRWSGRWWTRTGASINVS